MFHKGVNVRNARLVTAAIAATALAWASDAYAGQVAFHLDDHFSGLGTPEGTLSATISDVAPGSVMITMDATTFSGPWGVNIGRWWFNSKEDPTTFAFEYQAASSGPKAEQGIHTAFNPSAPANQFKPDRDGYFDILFDFKPTGANGTVFQPGEVVNYLVQGVGITAETFNLLSDHTVQGAGPNGPFTSVARLTGFPGGVAAFLGADDAVVTGDVAPVPIPGAALLFGTSLFSLGFLRRHRAHA
ncbi:MAG: hypothetical protein IPM60_04735 [Rhodospirillales bacterium]|nr:hypothetical protein [Rhodospirillales bacterium]